MATLVELLRENTMLDRSAIGHLQRLVGSWGMLADFCFGDLLLFSPISGEAGSQFVVVGQIRPTTGQTLYRDDLVGDVVDEVGRPLLARSWRLEQIIDGEYETSQGERARVQCIPVRWNGRMLGVLTRESAPSVGRRLGELERRYLATFEQFARMISEGDFPFATEDASTGLVPRVGDGVVILDEGARVEYASPNAISALHRMGVHPNTEGMRLGEIGFPDGAVRSSFAFGVPVSEEVTRGTGGEITVVVRCIPLLREGAVVGAVVLVRDVTDLRRRDRMLLSMDATIREVHHRVKNNLQTISSLLRLQARRIDAPEARAAISESVRRIRAIALVHEKLSTAPNEQASFDEIVRPLVQLVEEGLLTPDRPVHIEVKGEAGELPAQVATPLALVLAELLQNAVDHAFPLDPVEPGRVTVELEREDEQVTVRVRDNGRGLPENFSLENASGLGLTIVRALVTSELGGEIVMVTEAGTIVELRVPVHPPAPVET
jgi:two-component system, sensor histidine kinase PdtaS